MTIKYVGKRDNNSVGGYCRNKRFAEFFYRDEEEKRFDKIANYLEMQGYKIDMGVVNCAIIEVADREEYNDVVVCFREAKKVIKLNT